PDLTASSSTKECKQSLRYTDCVNLPWRILSGGIPIVSSYRYHLNNQFDKKYSIGLSKARPF
ncbi:MAG: hypothetical protein KJ663_05910, partial [Proteobacteria bacterium]|nr:hypothetical protein [Pseudomonadota bacterium]